MAIQLKRASEMTLKAALEVALQALFESNHARAIEAYMVLRTFRMAQDPPPPPRSTVPVSRRSPPTYKIHPRVGLCAWCGAQFVSRCGVKRVYCSKAHRSKAYRARRE